MIEPLEEHLKDQYSANRRRIDTLYGNIQAIRRKLREYIEFIQESEDAFASSKALKILESGKAACVVLEKVMKPIQEKQARMIRENPHIEFYY